MDHVVGDVSVVGFSWRVMNHGSVSTSRTDGIKAESLVMLKLVSSGVDVLCCLIFIDFLLFGPPCPKLDLCDRVSDVAVSETINLLVRSYGSLKSDSFPLDRFFKVRVNVVIQGAFLNQGLLWELRFVFFELNVYFAQMVNNGLAVS